MFEPNMPFKFAPVFRACCVVGLLLVLSASAAEQKPSLVGATREQVIARFGAPKSHIVAGDREVIFYPSQRLVLRNNTVVEVEELAVETPTPTPAPPPAANAESDAKPASPVADSGTQDASKTAGPSAGTASDATGESAPAPKPPPPVAQIISVRPPSKDRASVSTATPPPPPSSAAPVAPPPNQAAVPNQSVATPSGPPPATAAQPLTPTEPSPAVAATTEVPVAPKAENTPAPSAPPVSAPESAAVPAEGVAAGTSSTATSSVEPAAAASLPPKVAPKSVAKKRPANGAVPEVDLTETIFTKQTYAIALLVIAGGIAYLWWRSRERRLELAATTVSRSPFVVEQAPTTTGTRFTPELLVKLEWKRFEELVASYYNKTGVVAARTKAGPASPVHIRISWKGETRPFACVQCVSRPSGLIEAKQIQTLCDAIAAEDIRRGYVVTTGKFGVPARDLAEEKHITLLSGDIFLEKLNALPEAARSELMREAIVGDYTTPSCPACDVKMVRSAADSSVWQCPQCGTVLPRV